MSPWCTVSLVSVYHRVEGVSPMDGEHPFSSPDTVPFPQTRHICAIIILSWLVAPSRAHLQRGAESVSIFWRQVLGACFEKQWKRCRLENIHGSPGCIVCSIWLASQGPNSYLQTNAAVKSKSSHAILRQFKLRINRFLGLWLRQFTGHVFALVALLQNGNYLGILFIPCSYYEK